MGGWIVWNNPITFYYIYGKSVGLFDKEEILQSDAEAAFQCAGENFKKRILV